MSTVIAISGLPGAGSTTVSKLLAEKLNIQHFSPGRLYKDIATGKLANQDYYKTFKEICDKKGLIIPEQKNKDDSSGALNLWQTEFGKSSELHKAIDELQAKLSEQSNIVFDGKLSLKMIEKANPKVWLTASLKERAERTAERDNLKKENAEEILKKRQEIERKEWLNIYGIDYWEQEKTASLTIDTTNLSPEQTAQKIIEQLQEK
ncbi:MAG: (d)CMP kinase [Nanoarchaeota archaeon]|nr:(d)CMP kinase [Nanoarchaeota archaeon]MBU0977307.1 (d)CMP kinase [Nanoarchaeota archaeon]